MNIQPDSKRLNEWKDVVQPENKGIPRIWLPLFAENGVVEHKTKQFPQIIQWLKDKCMANSSYILQLIGKDNYLKFLSKFQQRKAVTDSREFAEMFWNEIKVMEISSKDTEKSIIQGYINSITSNYEIERKHFQEKLEEEKREKERQAAEDKKINDLCFDKVEHYINYVLEIETHELKLMLPDQNSADFIVQAYQEFKKECYKKYRNVFLEPHNEGVLIKIIQDERINIRNKVRQEIDRLEAQRIQDQYDDEYSENEDSQSNVNELKPKPKNGFCLSYGTFIRENDNKSCRICLSDYTSTDEIIILEKCKHIFHKGCLETWQQDTCPMCRANIK